MRQRTRLFVAEKNWQGCRGLTLTDEIKVTVAAQACLLVLARDLDDLSGVESILIYPVAYAVPPQLSQHFTGIARIDKRSGEAWYRGPLILNWADVLEQSRDLGGGHNLVWHEFAHKLDMLDRETDGTPPWKIGTSTAAGPR